MHQSDGSRLSAVPSTFREVASSWAAVSSVCSAKSASAQSQVKTSGLRPFQDPSAKVAAAKERVLKLETALAAMEGMEGPEVDSLRSAHKRAQEEVQGVPVDVQIKECESFLARARAHSEELDSKRTNVIQNITMSEKRLAELKFLSQAAPADQEKRGRSTAVERDGFPVTGADRKFAFRSNLRQPFRRSSAEADVPSRRICSSVRRGNGGMDGGATQRSSSCHGVGKAHRGGEGSLS